MSPPTDPTTESGRRGAGLHAAGRSTIVGVTVLVCARCGQSLDSEADGLAALAWVHSHEHGRDVFYCPACARENLRSIEGKLDAEFW